MLYLRLLADKTHYPYAPEHLRAAYPQTSFPRSWSPVLLAEYGVYPVQATVPPSYDPLAATLEEGPPRRGESGWVQTWAVVALSPEEVAARRAAARAAMGCTPRQARLALKQAGLLGAVTAWIASAEETTRIEWEFALEIRRDWPAIVACAVGMGLDDEQLDGLFTLAVTL
jgi:hypothetical protein